MASTTSAGRKRTASSAPAASKAPAAKSIKAAGKSTEIPAKETSTKVSASRDTKPGTLTLSYHTGDIFDAPSDSLLIHACNTQGSWGAGIAAAFRTRYPQAYKAYRNYCVKTHDPATNAIPTGTCLLIPPCETNGKARKHWVGCLFTSAKYGRARDKPDVIVGNTGPAMEELLRKANEAGHGEENQGVKEIRMCKINSARFGVPWERTVSVLEGIIVEGWAGDVKVWSIDEG